MLTALLPNGKLVAASEYDEKRHSMTLVCIDPSCGAPVVFVEESSRAVAHFKTVGKGDDSRHSSSCGFFEPLDVIGAINKTAEYQTAVDLSEDIPKQVITLNLRRLDPDEISKVNEKKDQKEVKEDEAKVKEDNDSPGVINSLKGLVKLLTAYEPDVLATIYFNVGGGRKLPLSHVVMSPERAYETLWGDRTIRGLQYFVYGRITEVRKLEKVMYIDFDNADGLHPFTVVIFADYFKHFKYKPEELKNRDVLVFGELRKNDYNDRKKSEIVIKSSKYMEFFKRKISEG
jgi:hypothetical protein